MLMGTRIQRYGERVQVSMGGEFADQARKTAEGLFADVEGNGGAAIRDAVREIR